MAKLKCGIMKFLEGELKMCVSDSVFRIQLIKLWLEHISKCGAPYCNSQRNLD